MSDSNFMLKFIKSFINRNISKQKNSSDSYEFNFKHKNVLLTHSCVEKLEEIIKGENLPYKIVYFNIDSLQQKQEEFGDDTIGFNAETKVSRVWDGILDIDSLQQKQEKFGDEEQDFVDIIGYGANEYRIHAHLFVGTGQREDIILNINHDQYIKRYVIKYEVGVLLNPLSEKDRIRDMARRKETER